MTKYRLSSILAILTIAQFILALGMGLNIWTNPFFTLEHEDTIFIMHLMTWFIVRAIEKIFIFSADNVTINNLKEAKDE